MFIVQAWGHLKSFKKKKGKAFPFFSSNLASCFGMREAGARGSVTAKEDRELRSPKKGGLEELRLVTHLGSCQCPLWGCYKPQTSQSTQTGQVIKQQGKTQ